MHEDLTEDLSLEPLEEAPPASGPVALPQASSSDLPGYHLEECLGQGAHGPLWRGIQRSTGQAVAIRLLRPLSPRSQQALQRAIRSGGHPYVVGFLDADLERQAPYLVTALMPTSLATWKRHQGADAAFVEKVALWLKQAAQALTFLHRRGLYHLDIKPQSVLIDSQSVLRLADLGLPAGQLGGGTCPFVSPFQARAALFGEAPSPAWDLYALGATFYSLLTGSYPRITSSALRRLEYANSVHETARSYWVAVHSSPLVPIRELNSDVDTRLAMILERCLELDPNRHYEQASELLADLEMRAQFPTQALDEWVYSCRSWAYRLGF